MDRPSTSADESDSKATRAGTAETVASLSARFSAPLRRFFAKRRIPRDDVDDLVQDVFVRLASRPNLGATERLDAYLFTTAANLLNDRRRRQISRAANAHESFDEDLHGDLLDATGPERTLLATQTVAKLIEALYELPERTRAVFVLYHFEDYPHAEIARQLGIAVSTIEKHMGRANAHLLTRMDGL